ncbi:MAG: hypothetical protein AAFX90_10070 [Pseudomonadota bacterium]
MTTYTAIPNDDVDQDSPVNQTLMTLLRDNPIAITEGAAGAPRILDLALDTTVTTTGTSWVRLRYAATFHNNVGSLVLGRVNQSAGAIALGSTVAGSLIFPATAGGAVSGGLAGTWRCLGFSQGIASDEARTTLWIRIS